MGAIMCLSAKGHGFTDQVAMSHTHPLNRIHSESAQTRSALRILGFTVYRILGRQTCKWKRSLVASSGANVLTYTCKKRIRKSESGNASHNITYLRQSVLHTQPTHSTATIAGRDFIAT